MANRRSFKTDESFLEKLAIGAIGARAVFDQLQVQGHRPIELERGSMDYKIWKSIKIKRLRVPDILCLNCAVRIEARAKTRMEISMSHSTSDAERGWDKGLADRDVVALSLCSKNGPSPIDWCAMRQIQFVAVSDLRQAFNRNQVLKEKPKGASEGFEIRVTWPSAVANCDGTIHAITPDRIQYRRASDGRIISIGLQRQGIDVQPRVNIGDPIHSGQIIASGVPVAHNLACRSCDAPTAFLEMLGSPGVADRYTATKALSRFQEPRIADALTQRMTDNREHVYVRLEAAAGLARLGNSAAMQSIESVIRGEYLEHRLEAVIILGEISTEASRRLLTSTLLDPKQHPEIRGGAAWALGELRHETSAESLVQAFLEVAEPIRVEAARALRKIAANSLSSITSRFTTAASDQRAGIAWAIAHRSTAPGIQDLLPLLVDDDARRWIAFVIGTHEQQAYIGQIEQLRARDPEVYFAATVLWTILASWIKDLEEY